jgi:hypothetical protein
MAKMQWRLLPLLAVLVGAGSRLSAQTDVYLLGVPDYDWYDGCFATATGNLMGYWDRQGFPDFYTGLTTGGVAPLFSNSVTNGHIRAFYISKEGTDGRPMNKPGHHEDYRPTYVSASADPDPYVVVGRPEHSPDCLGDFIGLSQRKYTNMNDECDGNVDDYAFNFWDKTGNPRYNYVPTDAAGTPIRDIQSGIREWTRWRGYEADVFSQLADFNPTVQAGRGFTFNDLKAEIDAGYPVLFFQQYYTQYFRVIPPLQKANPEIHALTAYGYFIDTDGSQWVHYRTSWGDSWGTDTTVGAWDAGPKETGLPIRGVIAYHPKPKIRTVRRADGNVTMTWDGPASFLYDSYNDTTTGLHRYVVERAPALDQPFVDVTTPSTNHSATMADCCNSNAFFRVRLITP